VVKLQVRELLRSSADQVAIRAEPAQPTPPESACRAKQIVDVEQFCLACAPRPHTLAADAIAKLFFPFEHQAMPAVFRHCLGRPRTAETATNDDYVVGPFARPL
jgi:hypothetical protein